jgi:hypothetical protein
VALTRTLAQLRDSTRRAADVVAFTDKHPDSAVNDLINRGLGALQRLTAQVNPEFRPLASTTITCDGENTLFALPADCRSIISVEYTGDNSDERTWLIPYEMHERAALTNTSTTLGAGHAHCYRQIGANLELLPLASEDHTARVWYATTATQLSDDADTVDVFDRLDDYVIWWAAREIAMERSDWERHSVIDGKLSAMTGDIMVLARQRDVSHPTRIVDMSHADRYGRHRRRGWY